MDKVKKVVVVPFELEKTIYKKPKVETPKTPKKKRNTKPEAPKKTVPKKKVTWTIVD